MEALALILWWGGLPAYPKCTPQLLKGCWPLFIDECRSTVPHQAFVYGFYGQIFPKMWLYWVGKPKQNRLSIYYQFQSLKKKKVISVHIGRSHLKIKSNSLIVKNQPFAKFALEPMALTLLQSTEHLWDSAPLAPAHWSPCSVTIWAGKHLYFKSLARSISSNAAFSCNQNLIRETVSGG
jgi:hypothetical protein